MKPNLSACPVSYSNRDTSWTLDIVIQEVLWSIRVPYSIIWSLNLKCYLSSLKRMSNDNLNLDQLQFPTHQIFHQFHDFDTELDLYRIKSGFHGAFVTDTEMVWHANPPVHQVPFIFRTYLCSNYWGQFFRTCRVFFFRLFNLNIPQYFLDFALRPTNA